LPARWVEELSVLLRQAGISRDPVEYASMSLDLAFLGFSLVSVLGLFLFPSVSISAAVSCAFLVLATSIAAPVAMRSRRALQVECELGVTLQSMALMLHFGQDFDNAMKNSPKGSEVERLFRGYFARVQAGSSPQAALDSLVKSVDSPAWRRACSQLSFAYHKGGAGHLESAAGEMFALQRQHHRKFAQQLSLLALFFAVAGGLLPALAGAYAVASPLLGGTPPLSDLDIYILYLVAFPGLALAVSLAASFLSPPAPEYSAGAAAA
jgi:hypothetical protein